MYSGLEQVVVESRLNGAEISNNQFLITGAYIVPAIIFILCGTAAIQKWNEVKTVNKTTTE
jgi:hypothetical protein